LISNREIHTTTQLEDKAPTNSFITRLSKSHSTVLRRCCVIVFNF
jgi:hypothetical protein